MFRLYWISVLRFFNRHRGSTLINILGLTLTFAVFFTVIDYVNYEYGFDTFYKDAQKVYRVNTEMLTGTEVTYRGAKSPQGMGNIKEQISEIEANVSLFYESCQVKYEDVSLFEQNVLWASEGFPDVFPIPMQYGNAAFERPHTGIISARMAKAIFGNENPMGKTIKVNEGFPIEITGVFNNLPSNTHLVADYFISVKTWIEYDWVSPDWFNGWNGNSMWNYIKADPKNIGIITQKLNDIVSEKRPTLKQEGRKVLFHLQALKDVHFETDLKNDYGPKTNRKTIINLLLFSLFVLVSGWINYINLTTAQAMRNAHSTGIQRIIGAEKRDLILKSAIETFFTYSVSFVLGYGLFFVVRTPFANMLNLSISTAYTNFSQAIVYSVAVFIVGYLLTFAYSAAVALKINPAFSQTFFKKGKVRTSLIVIQLTFTVLFLSVTLIVNRQISFMQHYKLNVGLNKVVLLSGPTSFNGEENYTNIDIPKIERFRLFREALRMNGVADAGTAVYDPIGMESRHNNNRYTAIEGTDPGDVAFYRYGVDNEFVKTYNLKLLAGKPFPDNKGQYRAVAIINEMAMKQLGYNEPEALIGKKIFRGSSGFEVCGVVKDYHHEGLQKSLYPMVFEYDHPSEFGYYAFRLAAGDVQQQVSKIEKLWKQYYPRDPFNLIFQDEYYNRQYQSEVRMSKVFTLIALVSVMLCCLGLYGMLTFFIARKVKEVGIRKVNGASVTSILVFLNRNMMAWVALAGLIAIPIVFYLMNRWLQNFAYRTELSWWIFALTGLLALGIALLTVSWQSWRAATRNPVESLRYE